MHNKSVSELGICAEYNFQFISTKLVHKDARKQLFCYNVVCVILFCLKTVFATWKIGLGRVVFSEVNK